MVQAGQGSAQSMRIDATIRTFWMRPSWTTTCDVVVDVRARNAGDTEVWSGTLESHVETFVGWFTAEAFEEVARLTLDQLVQRAAEAFRSPEFASAMAAGTASPPAAAPR